VYPVAGYTAVQPQYICRHLCGLHVWFTCVVHMCSSSSPDSFAVRHCSFLHTHHPALQHSAAIRWLECWLDLSRGLSQGLQGIPVHRKAAPEPCCNWKRVHCNMKVQSVHDVNSAATEQVLIEVKACILYGMSSRLRLLSIGCANSLAHICWHIAAAGWGAPLN
jgi:hypothetical protein